MNQIVLTHQYTVENYFTFSVYVHSGGFSGISNFCLSERSLKDAIISLNKLCESLSGMYQINDCDSNDYILFEFLKLGHIKITGQLGGNYNPQYLCFQFISDQTVLQAVISTFSDMLSKSKICNGTS